MVSASDLISILTCSGSPVLPSPPVPHGDWTRTPNNDQAEFNSNTRSDGQGRMVSCASLRFL